MKISAVISSDLIKKERYIKDKTLLLCFAVIASGLVSGTFIYLFAKEALNAEILDAFLSYFTSFSHKTKIEIFSGMLIANLPYILLVIVLGTSAYGSVFIAIFSFIKIAGLGILSAYFYSEFALKGVEYSLLVFFPGKFMLILSVLFMMHYSINNSIHISRLIKGEYKTENSSSLYSVKTATAVMMFILSSLFDCFMAVSFSSLFSFG